MSEPLKEYSVLVTVQVSCLVKVMAPEKHHAEGQILLTNDYDDNIQAGLIAEIMEREFSIQTAEAEPEEGDICPYCEFARLARSNKGKLFCPHCTESALYAQDMIWGEDDPPPASPYTWEEA